MRKKSCGSISCPQVYLGKNTGVGCHFLLQGSSLPRGWTSASYVSCIGRWILYHWATWEPLVSKYYSILKESGLLREIVDCRSALGKTQTSTPPFSRWGNWGTEALKGVFEVKWLWLEPRHSGSELESFFILVCIYSARSGPSCAPASGIFRCGTQAR